jgi:hypothetical protein
VHDIEFLMLLLLAIALLAQLAGHLQVPYPVFLVLGGLAIALVPGSRGCVSSRTSSSWSSCRRCCTRRRSPALRAI